MNEYGACVVGIDLGDRKSMARDYSPGVVVKWFEFPMTPAGVREAFEGQGFSRVVMEAGARSRWVTRLLRTLGYEPLVASARKLKAISANERKSDRNDALVRGRSKPISTIRSMCKGVGVRLESGSAEGFVNPAHLGGEAALGCARPARRAVVPPPVAHLRRPGEHGRRPIVAVGIPRGRAGTRPVSHSRTTGGGRRGCKAP